MATIDVTIQDDGLVGGLKDIADALQLDLHLNETEPVDYAGAIGTSLGTDDQIQVAAPTSEAGPARRQVQVAAGSGTISSDGTVNYVSLVDTNLTLLKLTVSVANPQAVTNGNPFTTTSFAVAIPDPV